MKLELLFTTAYSRRPREKVHPTALSALVLAPTCLQHACAAGQNLRVGRIGPLRVTAEPFGAASLTIRDHFFIFLMRRTEVRRFVFLR